MNIASPDTFTIYWSDSLLKTNLIVLLNIVGAMGLGLIVGYERSYHGRAAGMRTYGFVCMASCALTVLAAYPQAWFGGHASFTFAIDPTRVIQGVVTGIGFLGAGVIMKEGFSISGLTTAASIWASSAIGVLVGIGFYVAAIAVTFLSAGLMMWGGRLEGWLPQRPAIGLIVRFRQGFVPQESVVIKFVNDHGYGMAFGSLTIAMENGQPEWHFIAVAHHRLSGSTFAPLSNALAGLDGVENFRLYRARN